MNYYRRHIGDYLRDTAHLSLLEHGIYARLLDVYYTREEALPPLEQTARLIGARAKDERAALELVLREFFEEIDGRWRQTRCEREIEASREKAERNREVGKRGGRPRKVETQTEPRKNPDGFQTQTETEPKENPSHKPIANSQEPVGTERASRATHTRTRAPAKRPLPDGFGISDRVAEWAQRNGHGRLQEHLEAFVSKARARGYVYVDWDEALMGAIRDDWAGLNAPAARASPHRQPTLSERNAAAIREFMTGECHDPFAPSAPAAEVIDV